VQESEPGEFASGPAGEFDAFYEAHYRDVTAMAYALTGDLAEAEDVTQEAFCRAWQRWHSIVHYEHPGAWVRRVVANLAVSRWRRLRTAAKYLSRSRLHDTPALDPAHVAVVTALRTLPRDQAHALVLHHMVDLPVAEVAREMGVAVGTVKSWLHRGRAAMATRLGDETEEVAA
jgi:RNA polymerase sigma-70 factor, ECF subfamily